MFQNGRGLEKNNNKAMEWYRKASDQGFLASQVNLINMYHEGIGIPKEDLKAIEWFYDLAENKHIMAQYKLAEIYYLGTKTKQDYTQAYAWAGIVAARGFKPAQEIRDNIEIQLNEK